MSDRAGQASALMVLTPIVPGQERALRDHLEALPPAGGSPLARSPSTHFARWVILDDFVNDPEQPTEDHLGCQYLIFTSNFDGELDPYLTALCRVMAEDAEAIWGRCVGCPWPARGDALKAYLMHNKIDTGFFFCAYPSATLPAVREALARRAQAQAFAIRAQRMAPADLHRAFLREFVTP